MNAKTSKKIANARWGHFKVFGKSFKYNQICDISAVGSTRFGVSFSVENNKLKIVGTGTSFSFTGIGIVCNKIVDHYYAILINNNVDGIGFNVVGAGGNTTSSKVVKATSTDNRLTIYIENEKTYNSLIDLNVIDLTELFGAGNEPTTIEQFYATDLGKAIQDGFYPPYSAENKIYSTTSPLSFYIGNTLKSTYSPTTPLVLRSVNDIKDTWKNWNGKIVRADGTTETTQSIMLSKKITKVVDANGVELEFEVLNN